MKRILLTSTALVMVAGIAAADGHASLSWSGAVTAGMAREGAPEATAAETITTAQTAERTALIAVDAAFTTLAAFDAEMVVERAAIATTLRALANVRPINLVSETNLLAGQRVFDARSAVLDQYTLTPATAKADAGNFRAYSEINATVTGTVTAGGMTLSAGMSVDAGDGYDFADDDGFDNRTIGSVGLDSVSLDLGSAGKLTLDDNNIAHLVDGDDDAAGDVSYTNTFGGATFTAVLDLEKDDLDTPAALAIDSRAAVAADVRGFTAATATTAAIEEIGRAHV